MPTDAGEIYAQTGRELGHTIASAMQRHEEIHRQQDKVQQQVQGLLDGAKTLTINDPKTGKPKPFFSPEQVQHVQSLLDQHKAYQAGSLAAGMGMGANAIARIRQQQAMSGGPVSGHLPDGTPIIVGPTGAVHTYVPRNAQGQTTNSQITQNRQAQIANARNAMARQTGFDTELSKQGLNRMSLFSPNVAAGVEQGAVYNGKFYTPGEPAVGPDKKPLKTTVTKPDPANPGQTTSEEVPIVPVMAGADGSFDRAQVNAVRVGYQPADPKNATAPGGKPGKILSMDDFNALQEQAVYMGDPNAQRAKQWLDNNKDSPDYEANQKRYQGYLQKARAMMDPTQTVYNPEYRSQVLSAGGKSSTDTTLNLPSAVPEGTSGTEGVNAAPPQDEQQLDDQ
jgi:hypothetical protein